MTDLFTFLDGRTYTHNGIEGTFRHVVRDAIYPYPHTVQRLVHEPTAKGKASDAYRAEKARMGDDWDTDLTDAFDTVAAIALEFGY